jgi:hypothetical protein
LNGKLAGPLVHRDDGLVEIAVEKGRMALSVDWTTTRDVLAGRWLSGGALILLIALGWVERRSLSASRGGLS